MHIQYDYSNFDPEAGGAPNFPPEGNYDLRLINITPGETRNGKAKITLDFLTLDGTNTAFPMNYNTGHSNPEARRIAFEDLGRIYYGITGQKPPASGYDISTLLQGEFNADLIIKSDGQYTNANLRNIKPKGQAQQSSAPQVAYGQAAQPQAAPAGQPAVNKPAWAQN